MEAWNQEFPLDKGNFVDKILRLFNVPHGAA